MHRRLDLDETLAALLADGLLSEADAKRVRVDIRTARGRSELHPLVLVANLKLADLRHPDKPLSLEVLTHWLAEKAGLPYLKIDPMKIDVASVTQVVSHAYAQRYRILPVAVTDMPFLKPLIAAPTSSPTLRSFFVPNTSAMITSRTNQCQMLKPPIGLPVRRSGRRAPRYFVVYSSSRSRKSTIGFGTPDTPPSKMRRVVTPSP